MSSWFRAYGYAAVHDRLIVGALPQDAADVHTLAELGVTRVLNLVCDDEYERGARRVVERALSAEGIEEHRLHSEDFGSLEPELLEQASTLVNGWLDQGELVYLHCRAGWQRSAAVAAAAIAVHDGVTIRDALEQIQQHKPTADPLPHQREDLSRWFEARAAPGR